MNKTFWKKLLQLILGTCCISFAIAIMSKADIGMSAISSFPYVLAKLLPALSLGNWVLLWNVFFALLQIPLLGKKYKPYLLLQIPLAFLLGYVTDFAKWIIGSEPFSSYLISLAVALVGVVFTGLGVWLTVHADLIMNGPEAFLHSLAEKTGIRFGTLKVIFDVSIVLTAVITSLIAYHKIIGVREGTVLAAVCTGFVVNIIGKIYQKLKPEK